MGSNRLDHVIQEILKKILLNHYTDNVFSFFQISSVFGACESRCILYTFAVPLIHSDKHLARWSIVKIVRKSHKYNNNNRTIHSNMDQKLKIKTFGIK